MKVLLDTQIWLWWYAEPSRLSKKVQDLIESDQNEVYFSAASSLEIAIKLRLGKLHLPEEPTAYVLSRLALGMMIGLPVSHEHALKVATLPRVHEDPFDRLLVTQAICEKLHLITADKMLSKYPVPVIRAW